MSDYSFPGEQALSDEYNELASYYSDFHKDVYGFRPRWIVGCACDFTSVDELRAAKEQMRKAVDQLHADIDTIARQAFQLVKNALEVK